MITDEAVEAAGGTSPTLTPDAVAWFRVMADEAERDISLLPDSSQPLWFRTCKATK